MGVVVDQGAGLDREHLQAVPDRLLDVVGPVLGRRPPGQPAQQLLLGDVEAEGGLQWGAELGQAPVQGLGLGHGAREPVQREPGLAVPLGQPLHDHGDDHLVGHQVAPVHVLLGGPTQLGPLGHIRPEDVPGGHVGAGELLRDLTAWVPLPAPGGPETTSLN